MPSRRTRGVAAALILTAIDVGLLALAMGGLQTLVRTPRVIVLISLWTIASLVLAAIRPAGAPVPAEPREPGAEPRLILLALFLVPLATPPLSAWTERIGFGVLPGGTRLEWTGVLLVALGLTLRIAAMAQLGRRFSPRLAIQNDHVLETRGLYAWVRHPGYLGALIGNLGAALAFASLTGVALTALLAVVVRARTAHEEVLLSSRFGEEWRRYRLRTRAFLPLPARTRAIT
ncbi:MAG TPA: isoprenylcysteine carboxylmethyltransferase family protein [Candidatus Udaeobacter sp.]|jgi:protein-S-isoprenylcysteine O-methyltransferase Ste14|nr:isoprenylcysteine carboxylmethyltransferase family protein [Candidatus Udaeobacter sp.]